MRFKVRTLPVPRVLCAVIATRMAPAKWMGSRSGSAAHHDKKRWQVFTKDAWLYTVDLNAPDPKKKKR